MDGFVGGLDDAAGEQWAVAVAAGDGHGGGLLVAAVADGPVGCARRLLYEEAGGGVVPEDRPADGPAVAGAHGAAVL